MTFPYPCVRRTPASTMHAAAAPSALRALAATTAAVVVIATLAACSAPGPRTGGPTVRPEAGVRPPVARGGGYYQDDGPGENPPADLMSIPDAVPRPEPLLARANRPYVVFERQYQPMVELTPFRQRGVASWYGRKFHGRRTSSGEVYDMYAMTAAHPTLPIPSYARVTHTPTGRSVVVRVNDRGPFLHDRVIDLSYTAAARLGYAGAGSAPVEVELITRFDGPAVATTTGMTAATAATAATVAADVRFVQVAATGADVARPERLDVETVLAPAERAPVPASATPASSLGPPAASAAPESGLYLQLGAFSSRENADAARERLESQIEGGAPIRVRADGALFKVMMGPYPRRADALAVAERIGQRSGARPFIVNR